MSFDLHTEMDKEINAILDKHMFDPITQETCDAVMVDIVKVFGHDAAAHVILDDEDNSIEIHIKDILSNIRAYKREVGLKNDIKAL
jgi:hypothetical protein